MLQIKGIRKVYRISVYHILPLDARRGTFLHSRPKPPVFACIPRKGVL